MQNFCMFYENVWEIRRRPSSSCNLNVCFNFFLEVSLNISVSSTPKYAKPDLECAYNVRYCSFMAQLMKEEMSSYHLYVRNEIH